MIDFPIIDSHLHIWDSGRIDYPWLKDVTFLNRPFLIDDYKKACGRVKVDKMVFVQAEADFSQFREEVEWVSQTAGIDKRIKGIVAWAPLEKGKAAEEDLNDLAKNPLLKGIRRIIQFEDDIRFCLREDFIEGVKLLPKYNLSFDICINHIQLENTIKFVERCPDVQFILDHIGKPDIKNQLFEPWKAQLKQLSRFPNVFCKVSGLVTEADHKSWTRDDLKPYIDHVIECFGFDKVLYGGDWPVAAQATDYERWVETLEWAVSGVSESDLHGLFYKNAQEFYRV